MGMIKGVIDKVASRKLAVAAAASEADARASNRKKTFRLNHPGSRIGLGEVA